MNEELIRQYTREAYRSAYGRDIPPHNDIGKFAKELLELHHARAVAPLVEAVEAYKNAVRVYTMPIAGYMGMIDEPARNLREALAPFRKEAK